MDEMRKPHVGTEPTVIGHPRDRPLAESCEAIIDIVARLREMAMDAQSHRARACRNDSELVGSHRPGRSGHGTRHPARAVGGSIVIGAGAVLPPSDHAVEGPGT